MHVTSFGDYLKSLHKLLVLNQEKGLKSSKNTLIVLTLLEVWLLSGLLEKSLCLIEGIAFDQTENCIDLHSVPLAQSEVLVFL